MSAPGTAGEEQGARPVSPQPDGVKRLTPKDAATVILVDRSGGEPRLLMGRRHDAVRFMPGKYVFPGGRVEAEDGRVNVAGTYAPHVERRLMAQVRRPSITRARAYGLAALRELAEETGLLVGEAETDGFSARGPSWEPFRERRVFPSLEGLHFIVRAITPPGRPRRFDTRFFAVDAAAVAARVNGVVTPDTELTELRWASFDEAAKLDLPDITRMVLDHLAGRLREGLERDLPVPFFRKGSKAGSEMV